MKAILLAGGKGTRLRPLTLHTPKPIVPIFDRPFLQYQIDLLRQVPEIDEVVLSLNYQPRRIEEVFGDGSDLGIQLRYVVEPTPLGTGGAIKFAAGEPRPRAHRGVQRRRLHGRGSDGRARAPPSPPRQSHDRAHAGRKPVGLRPRRDRRERQRAALPREAVARPDRLRHDQRRHLRARARHASTAFRSTPSSRSSAGISRRSSKTARHSSPTSPGATGSTSARPRSTGRPTATSWTAALPRTRSLDGPASRSLRRMRVSRTAPSSRDRASSDPKRVVKAGARIGRHSVIGRNCHVGEDAVDRGRDPLAELLGRQRRAGSAPRSPGGTATSAATSTWATAALLGDKSVVTDYSRM